ncbi:Conserved_hypothetical protein [Hexamita inflata]|uniref:HTH myb-type domain-containing protein n=1 Tax=Hexamita inflata TaxID=28002 RepID=A0AA86Q7T7_9EUKA|nr:Conserved hypothetical protein [Hexamita inflata]
MQNKIISEVNTSQISDRSKRTWTEDEQLRFTKLYKQYRKDFKQYVSHFNGRTESQIKSFYQNVIHNNIMIQKARMEQIADNDITSMNSTQIQTIQQQEVSVGLSLIVFETINFQQQ